MNVENVTTGDYDPEKMRYAVARINLTDITPSQLESIVIQLRYFSQHPPKKDLIFDGAIRVVNTILFPPRKESIILKHPNGRTGRPREIGGHYEFCPDIMNLLKIRKRSIAELRRILIPDAGIHGKECASFYVALRKLKKNDMIKTEGDYLALKENYGPRQGIQEENQNG